MLLSLFLLSTGAVTSSKPLLPSARPRQWEEKSSCFLLPTGNTAATAGAVQQRRMKGWMLPLLSLSVEVRPHSNPILSFLIHSRSCPRREALSTLAYSKEKFLSTNSTLTLWREQRCPENSGCSHLPSASCAAQVPFTPQDNKHSLMSHPRAVLLPLGVEKIHNQKPHGGCKHNPV